MSSLFLYKLESECKSNEFVVYNRNVPDLLVTIRWKKSYKMTYERMREVFDEILKELEFDDRRRDKNYTYDQMMAYLLIEKLPDFSGNVSIWRFVYNFVNGKFSDNKSIPAIKIYDDISRKKLHVEIFCNDGILRQYNGSLNHTAINIKGKYYSGQGYGLDSSNFELTMEDLNIIHNFPTLLMKLRNGLNISYLYRTTTYINPFGNTPTPYIKFYNWCIKSNINIKEATLEDYHIFKLTN